MKGKAILKSLLCSYVLTGLFLLGLAYLLFQFNLGEGVVTAGITAVYVIACLAGGIVAGKTVRKQKYLWGTAAGLCYFILLAAVSFLVEGKWDMSFSHTVTTALMCLGGGALGGMLS